MEQQTQGAAPRVADEAEAVQSGAVSYAEDVQAAKEQQQGITHPELEKAVAKMQAQVDGRIEEVRSDRRLDKNEQRQKMREVYDRAAEYHGRLLKAYERELEERSETAERGVFYVIPANRDSVRSAYNDAYDRTAPGFLSGEAEGIEYAREEMERLWERAVRTGDRALQTALGHLATERGDEKLRDAWLKTSEEKRAAWGRYVEARQKLDHWRDPQERMWGHLTQGWNLRKPEEL